MLNRSKQERTLKQPSIQTEPLELSQCIFPYVHLAVYYSSFTPRPNSIIILIICLFVFLKKNIIWDIHTQTCTVNMYSGALDEYKSRALQLTTKHSHFSNASMLGIFLRASTFEQETLTMHTCRFVRVYVCLCECVCENVCVR